MPARLKINFFTPLPAARTSVADHSARLFAPLAALADLAIWTDQDTWDAVDIPNVSVHRFTPDTDPALYHAADVNFYNLGNNHPFHGKIYDVARRVPGIAIIHDPNMGYFFADVARSGPQGRHWYDQFVAEHYGARGMTQALQVFAGKARLDQVMLRYPMTEATLEGALGGLVHHEELRTRLAHSTGLPIYYTPLSHSQRTTPYAAQNKPPYKLVTFGYLGSNRRLDEIAEALATFPQRDQFAWDIYGTVQVEGAASRLIKRCTGCKLTIHNFVEEDVLDRALSQANLAINLRNPTMGEASSSQLRLWEHGVPSLVSRVGWYASQPADTVYFVNPGDEVADVQKHLTDYLADPDSFVRTGERGRNHLYAVHGTDAYARAMADIAAEGRQLRVRHGAYELIRRATAEFTELAGDDAMSRLAGSLRDKTYELFR